MSKYRIYRHPEGISLNGKEFICGDDGEVKLFNTMGVALLWLKKQSGHTLKVNNAEELWEEYGIGIEKDYYKEFHD